MPSDYADLVADFRRNLKAMRMPEELVEHALLLRREARRL